MAIEKVNPMSRPSSVSVAERGGQDHAEVLAHAFCHVVVSLENGRTDPLREPEHKESEPKNKQRIVG